MIFKKSESIFRSNCSKLSKSLLPELVEIRLLVLIGDYIFRIESEICTGEFRTVAVLDEIQNSLIETRSKVKIKF